MSEDGTTDRVEEATGLLEFFGFTEYEAKCFVALSRVGSGTAKEVSEVADVPRARVYDCMDALADRGVVDVQQSSPRRFRAVDVAEAIDVLERDYADRLDRLRSILSDLEPPGESKPGGDVWVMEGNEAVSDRLERLVESATEEVLVAVAVEGLLTEDLLAALADAADRGVAITAGSPSAAIRERLRDELPGADVVETWTWWESHPIQPGAISSVVMADGEGLLVSADVETELPDVRTHRAVWTDDDEAPLVGMMRPLLRTAITGEAA